MSVVIKQSETRTLIDQTAFGSSETIEFRTLSGSRLVLSLHIESIDLGASVSIQVGNTFNLDIGYETILSFSESAAGNYGKILSDYHTLFQITATVTGGNATFKVGATVHDNAGTTRIDNANIAVDLSHVTDALGNYDSTRIGDGVDELGINPDGSINVVPAELTDEDAINVYNEITAVASGSETQLVTYTVPAGLSAFLYHAQTSGTNIAAYRVYLNGSVIATKRTYFSGGLNAEFYFETKLKNNLPLVAGDVLEIKVQHDRPDVGDFEGRIQLTLKG